MLRLPRATPVLGVLVAGLVGALTVPPATGATAPDAVVAPAVATTVLAMGFDDQSGQVTTPVVTGQAAPTLRTSVITARGGVALAVPSHAGGGTAVRLPAYAATNPPYAVLRVANPVGATRDPLDPRSGTFSWSAEFSQDADLGTTPSQGDNIVQRGLTSTRVGNTMWKLQADHHEVRCEVQTTRMTSARLTAPITVAPGTWYRATCRRAVTSTSATLTAVVERWDGSTWVPFARSKAVPGVGGSVTMATSVPVSIGGKLDVAGTALHRSPDQLNGLLDSVLLTVGG